MSARWGAPAVALVALVGFGSVCGTGGAALAQDAPLSSPSSVVITPAVPVPGQQVTAEVSGFAPGATVEVFVDGERTRPVQADRAGRATATIDVAGDHASSRQVVIAGQNPAGVRQSTTGVIDSRWPEMWAQGGPEDVTAMAFLVLAIAVLLVGSGAVIATHRRGLAAQA